MLTMTQIDSIRKMYYEQGKNISEISKITENDRKTVRNYIGKDDWNLSPPPAPGTKDRYAKLSPYKAECVLKERLHKGGMQSSRNMLCKR
jgi:transposase